MSDLYTDQLLKLLNMKEDFQMIHGERICGRTYYKLKIKEEIKMKMEKNFKVGDKVRVNKKATIEDFTKNHWNGCQLSTLAFIRKQVDSDEIFVVEENINGDCVNLKSKESNEHYSLVNINILEKIEEDVEDVKEMTIDEISKELGYKIKIKKEEE